jgi:hypothetical protein
MSSTGNRNAAAEYVLAPQHEGEGGPSIPSHGDADIPSPTSSDDDDDEGSIDNEMEEGW